MNEHQWRFLRDVAMLIQYAERMGFALTLGRGYASEAANRADGGTENSNHRRRLAIDLNLFIDGEYMTNSDAHAPLGEYWKSLDPLNRWGGDFTRVKDGNHYERHV